MAQASAPSRRHSARSDACPHRACTERALGRWLMSEIVSLELLFDHASEARIRGEWRALQELGVSSMGAHASVSNRPHLSLLVRSGSQGGRSVRPALTLRARRPVLRRSSLVLASRRSSTSKPSGMRRAGCRSLSRSAGPSYSCTARARSSRGASCRPSVSSNSMRSCTDWPAARRSRSICHTGPQGAGLRTSRSPNG